MLSSWSVATNIVRNVTRNTKLLRSKSAVLYVKGQLKEGRQFTLITMQTLLDNLFTTAAKT